MPRPPKINQKITEIDPDTGQEVEITVGEAIVRSIRIGAFLEDAAEAAGVASSTVHSWIARGKEHAGGDVPAREQPYVEFLDEVTRARAASVVFNLALVRRAAAKDWRAGQWLLSVLRPERYSKSRIELEHSGSIETRPELVDLSELSDEELDELARLQAKARGKGE